MYASVTDVMAFRMLFSPQPAHAPDDRGTDRVLEADRRLAVDSAFFRTFQIEDIVPPPFASENTSDGTVYHFRSEPEMPLPLTLHLRAQVPGIASYRVGVNDEAMQPARTIVWP